jgi:hypothetical protein
VIPDRSNSRFEKPEAHEPRHAMFKRVLRIGTARSVNPATPAQNSFTFLSNVMAAVSNLAFNSSRERKLPLFARSVQVVVSRSDEKFQLTLQSFPHINLVLRRDLRPV